MTDLLGWLTTAARDVLQNTLISEHETDRKGEPANIVDGLFALARAINRMADTYDHTNRPTQDSSK